MGNMREPSGMMHVFRILRSVGHYAGISLSQHALNWTIAKICSLYALHLNFNKHVTVSLFPM